MHTAHLKTKWCKRIQRAGVVFAGLSAIIFEPFAAWAEPNMVNNLKASEIRGVSWSDPRDNYNPAQIVPAGLSLKDTPEQAARVAEVVASRVLKNRGNVVRLGINPPTVADKAWWTIYEKAIRTLAGRGVGVILCAWEQSPNVSDHGRAGHDGRFGAGNVETYSLMWKDVHQAFADEVNVIGYELLNEPFGYRGREEDYAKDMRRLIAAMGPDLKGKRILVAGIGYSDNVQVLRRLFPEPSIWFAYHVYPNWFGGEAGKARFSREKYAEEIAKSLAGVEDRTVITEFGCWGGAAYDYSKPAAGQKTLNAQRHVAYLQGVADACERLKLGSIYWFANAIETRDKPAYDLFATDGDPLDADRMAEVLRAWRQR